MLQKENACWKKPAALIFRKQGHPQTSEGGQGWEETNVSDTLNIYDNSEKRTPTIIVDKAPPPSLRLAPLRYKNDRYHRHRMHHECKLGDRRK